MVWQRDQRDHLKHWARGVKRDAYAVYLASKDPRVPWYAKVVAICVAAYALSPIDLIPDFIPILGYLDDIVIVPLGIMLVFRLIPKAIMAEHRATAAASDQGQAVNRTAAGIIVIIWIGVIGGALWIIVPRL